MSRAFMGWISLAQDDLFRSQGKLATLWFDEVVLQTPREDMLSNVIDRLVSKGDMSQEIAEVLLSCWRPIQGVIDSFNFIDNPWESTSKEIQSATIESISDFTAEQYPELPRTHPGFLHEVAMGGAGILSSIATWSKLNADNGCILLANQIESRVVQKVFGSQNTAGLSSFSEIVSARIPNPEALSWQRIVDLRRSPYLEDFRRKLDIIESQVNKGDIKGVAELISEIEMNDLRRLARAVEPSMGTSSIKALLSNIPLPIPINPASMFFGAQDVYRDWERKKNFGWLYFLLDLH